MILNEIILQNVNGKGKGLTATPESDVSYLSSSNPSFGQLEMSQVNIVMGGTNNVERRESLKKKNVKKGRMKAISDRKLKQNVDKVKKTFGQLQTKSSVGMRMKIVLLWLQLVELIHFTMCLLWCLLRCLLRRSQ